jgi:hypothetical protein
MKATARLALDNISHIHSGDTYLNPTWGTELLLNQLRVLPIFEDKLNKDHHLKQFLYYPRAHLLLLKRVLISQQHFGLHKPIRCCANVPREPLSSNGRLCNASPTVHFRCSGIMSQYNKECLYT